MEDAMLPYDRTIDIIREKLGSVFGKLDTWFDRDSKQRAKKPASGGWSMDQILEHITLTNRFLMLTLRKWIEIAEQRAKRGDQIIADESDLQRLESIGQRGTFSWIRPEHMEPSGEMACAEVRGLLQQQLTECNRLLDRMKGGIGSLCRVTMTVNDLGKIDLYQWLFFLAQHAQRHLQQLEAIDLERESS
jgi:hypothetical protein